MKQSPLYGHIYCPKTLTSPRVKMKVVLAQTCGAALIGIGAALLFMFALPDALEREHAWQQQRYQQWQEANS